MVEKVAYPEWNAEMAAQEHIQTYNGVLAVTKWTLGSIIVVLVLMAIFLV